MAEKHEKRRKKYFQASASQLGGSISRERGPNPCKVFVGNISYKVSEKELKDFFADFGPVKYCQIVKDHNKKWSRGIGFVTFKNVKAVENAMSAPEDQLILDGRTLRVARPTTKKRLLAMQEALSNVEEEEGWEIEADSSEGQTSTKMMTDNSHTLSSSVDSEIPTPQGTYIPELNDDVLLLILSYLNIKERIRIERVSKRWRKVALSSWQYLRHISFRNTFNSFRGRHGGLSDEILHSVLRRGGKDMTSLDLSSCPQFLTDFGIDLIGMYCCRLEKLDLSGISVTQSSFKQLSLRCTHLKWLKISGCHSVGEKCVWWALHNWKQLQYLNISDNRRINGQCFYMAESTLRHIHLRYCDKLTDSNMELLTGRCPQLETLDISHCSALTGATLRSITQLRQWPEIDYIEEETMAEGTQTTLPYHLDRVDQRQLPLDGVFNPIGDGEGVDIYILDSGILYNHTEFGNRAKYSGYDPIDVYRSETNLGLDCHGHGTHVASNAAGEKYGAAKKATIYSIRVLDCSNRGPWSTTLEGLDHAMEVIASRKRPAIVSMSLSGGFTRSVNDAVQTLYSSGIPVVVAAGNGQRDACRDTPASAPNAITVGGSANGDGLYFATNYGSCVDIFAPGHLIKGANFSCTNCSQTWSGTSFAAPIVSGAIAILLQRKPLLTPGEIFSELVSLSVNNTLDFRVIPSNFRASTPNRALFIPGSCGGEITIDFSSNNTILSPNYPSNYHHNIYCKWIVTAPLNAQVRISFSSFSTEYRYDTVQLCSGYLCEVSTTLATLSGQLGSSTNLYNSAANVLAVVLITDGRVSSSGFNATVSPIMIQVPPTDPQPPTVTVPTMTSSTTSAPPTTSGPPTTDVTTSAPPTTTGPPTTDVTCPTVPPPAPTLNISMILQETLSEAETLLREAITNTLGNLLKVKLAEIDSPVTEPTVVTTVPPTNCRGCSSKNPAFYCQEIARANSGAVSGYYWVRGRYGVNRVYCDMSTRFMNTAGWMRVANLNMSDSNQSCPSGLGLVSTPRRTCGRSNSSPGCSSTFFRTFGVSYSRICGRVIGYQYSAPNAFFAYQYDTSITINDYYLDGVSLTRGNPRQHIWSFAATLDENSRDRHICPCTHSSHSLPRTGVPPFIGQDYFCDSGTASYQQGVFFTADPLWDGQGCGSTSSCCSFNNPPWFCKNLATGSLDSVELRICGNENTSNEDTPIEIVELYVQ